MTEPGRPAFDAFDAAVSEEGPGADGEEVFVLAGRGLSRRAFLKVAGAGLLITVLPLEALGQAVRRGGRGGFGGGRDAAIAARIHIAKDGAITVMTGKVEGGQGARTELTQAAAEELRLPPEQVQLVMGDTALVPNDGITAGSGTTPRTVPAVRRGAAAARDLLAALAARQWAVDASAVEIRDGKALHPGGGQALTYADLAADAAEKQAFEQPPGGGIVLTAVREWKALGRSVPRPNGRDIVTGAHRYPSDMTLPGMLYGKILRPPSYGARLTKVDGAAARANPGVLFVQEGSLVGVAAPTAFGAGQALAALAKTAAWETTPQPSSKEIFDYLRGHTREPITENPFAGYVAAAAKSLRQVYTAAYIQHAPLEPRNALAEWEGGKATVWMSTQNPFGCRDQIAQALGVDAGDVRVIVPDFGAGFGGRHTADAGLEAALLARAAGKPVLVRWTRTEEFTWAYFRPAAVIDIEASMDADGKLTSWFCRNINSGGSAIATPYRIEKVRTQFVASESPLRIGSYRALAATANNFARESAMDELAAIAGRDPLEFRMAHLEDPRLRAVLETAATRFGWAERSRKKEPNAPRSRPASGTEGIGLACGTEKGSCVAACVEIGIENGEIALRRACEVFECGAIINPANLAAQVHGCLIMGLGAALREEMEFENGKILNASFADYRVPRFRDVPADLDIHLLDRPDLPSAGAGETPIMVIAPAVANAVYRATGQRIRRMPIRLAQPEKSATAARRVGAHLGSASEAGKA